MGEGGKVGTVRREGEYKRETGTVFNRPIIYNYYDDHEINMGLTSHGVTASFIPLPVALSSAQGSGFGPPPPCAS